MTAPLGRINVRRRANLRWAGRRRRNARAPTSVGGRVPGPKHRTCEGQRHISRTGASASSHPVGTRGGRWSARRDMLMQIRAGTGCSRCRNEHTCRAHQALRLDGVSAAAKVVRLEALDGARGARSPHPPTEGRPSRRSYFLLTPWSLRPCGPFVNTITAPLTPSPTR
jgi:hypothetical protein